ncbi:MULTISPECIES: DUF7383 domain-containing protein [Haloarcula]|uniref:Uncharacterized protein n=1 Tax=Haloarcula pellucida TaxID=1427151 RepID=A0A830GQY9_9EURY|nr:MULTISPECIES: hypothetical protein [Halomicroarcula]MBX0349602.1 hypothetical protein [Halomicroarcula pellucida]MDS0278814.1 hypothetical protein [Halomicroarcula sp. S1AR25-4]GGO02157.1 hypothetical protein GCM10009030_36410 [Halomicroarcula pellucida]
MTRRANYARCTFQQHLGPDEDSLDVPWAEFSGDSTDPVTFEVPTDVPAEPYVEMQVYDVDAFTHEICLNDEPLSGFDIAPGSGWQYWMDTVGADQLHAGANTLQFERDRDSDDAFVVGTAIVHWKEPAE